MLQTNRLTIFFISIAVIIIAFLLTRKEFHAKFYNKTGHDIDSLVIGSVFIGHLSNNDSTEIVDFKRFHFDGSFPYEKLSGIVQKNNLFQFNWSWCGTGRNIKSKGSHQFDIKTTNQVDSIVFYLVKHGEMLFNFK